MQYQNIQFRFAREDLQSTSGKRTHCFQAGFSHAAFHQTRASSQCDMLPRNLVKIIEKYYSAIDEPKVIFHIMNESTEIEAECSYLVPSGQHFGLCWKLSNPIEINRDIYSTAELNRTSGTEHRERITIRSYLAEMFTLSNPIDILGFIAKNLYLIAILNEATQKVRDYFEKSELVLSLHRSPDSEAVDEQLVIYISTNLHPREAIQRRNEIYSTWWTKEKHRANGQLAITMKYR